MRQGGTGRLKGTDNQHESGSFLSVPIFLHKREIKIQLPTNINFCVNQVKRKYTHDRIWGRSVSILWPVFLNICIAASATLSSSILRHCNKDSYVSAEWNEVGCVKDRTWRNRYTFKSAALIY